jgi:hypothetical protein
VVVGTTGLEDAHTSVATIVVVDGRARRAEIGSVSHRAGYAPVGAIADRRQLVLSVQEGSPNDARVVVLDAAGRSRTLVDHAVPGQTPLTGLLAGRPVAVVVRELDATPAGATFDVVRFVLRHDDDPAATDDEREILASRHALWVTPVRGSLTPLRMLVKDGVKDGAKDGAAHIDVVGDGGWHTLLALPPVPSRRPVVVGDELWIEQDESPERRGRATVRAFVFGDAHARDDVLVRGLAGLSPVVHGGVVATGTGRKDGTLLVGTGAERKRPILVERRIGRAGVARPQAVSASGEVVVWLDRGAAHPGELWWVPASTSAAPVLLLAPAPRTAVSVYGVVDVDVGAVAGGER